MSNVPPIYYSQENYVNHAFSPSTIHTKNTSLFNFFARRLFRIAFNIYDFKLPKNWDKNFFLFTLFGLGYMAVLNTSKFGKIPMNCGLTGYNVFYQPHQATIINPLFNRSYELIIGKETELIYLQPDYRGISDIISYYADNMAITVESLATNTYNSRLSFIFLCDSKADKTSYQTMYDQVSAGNPAVFLKKSGLQDAQGNNTYDSFNADLQKNLIAPDLQEVLRKWEYEFLRVIGIPSQNVEKKQRMTTDEVNSSTYETMSEAEIRLECLQESFEKVRKMFGFSESELSVNWKHNPEKVLSSNNQRSELGGEQ